MGWRLALQGRCAMAAALQGGLRMRCGGGGGQGAEGAVGRCLEAQRGPTSLDEGMGHGAMKLWGHEAMGLAACWRAGLAPPTARVHGVADAFLALPTAVSGVPV